MAVILDLAVQGVQMLLVLLLAPLLLYDRLQRKQLEAR